MDLHELWLLLWLRRWLLLLDVEVRVEEGHVLLWVGSGRHLAIEEVLS